MAWNTHIPKFRRFVLQNFPFIEEDFDALTDYALICKVIEYLNTVIDSQNEVLAEVERFETNVNNEIETFETNITNDFNRLEGLFNELQSFVNNYFDNLDVQEEINNKLDEMAEDGTLQEIITTYIQSNVAWTFDTVADMKLATNLVDGSYARTLGFHNINDGGGALYYITNSGTADEMQIISVDTLYANLVLPEIVTPEMFGAYGDGTHDDSASWNKAVSVKRDVKAFEKTYHLTQKINVTDNIEIDCGGASFTTTVNTVFDITGEVITSLANENNYSANDKDYTISNTDYLSYSGYAFVHGNNNFQESRSNYLGGFTCIFNNGKIGQSYPIPVENTVIDIVKPITMTLKNIKGITHATPTTYNTLSIKLSYGVGCRIENIYCKKAEAYATIWINKSLNINIDNINITQDANLSDNVSYIIYIGDSSYCNTTNSYLFNKQWHCWTTSGDFLCYKNTCTNCEFISETGVGLQDHENALGTSIENCTATCMGLSGMASVKNVVIETRLFSSQKRCTLSLMPMTIKENAVYFVDGVKFNADPDTAHPYVGVWFSNSPQVTGKTYYFNIATIKNVYSNVRATTYCTTSDTTGSYNLGKVIIDNCQLEISLKRNGENYWVITNNEVFVNNINYYITDRQSDFGTSNNDQWNKVTITNSTFRQVRGVAVDVTLNSVLTTSYISNLSVSGKLNGCNILSRIAPAVILGASDVQIDSMLYSVNDKWFNINSKSGTTYYQHIDSGAFVTATVTA